MTRCSARATIRADGRKIHPMYLFEVKKPSESKGPWDYYKLRATIPAEEAFRPLKDGGCPLVGGYDTHSEPRASRTDRPRRRISRMFEIFGIPSQALFGQLLLGLINGSFYALLSLGLAVIFGLLNIINFAHGAQYMMGAFVAYFLLSYVGLGYWWRADPGAARRRRFRHADRAPMLKRIYGLDHLYGLLLTFGLALIIEGRVPQLFRLLGPALPRPRAAARRAESRLHVPAELPRLGGRLLAGRLPRHLVRDRAHQARLLSAGGDGESRLWCAPSASTCRA